MNRSTHRLLASTLIALSLGAGGCSVMDVKKSTTKQTQAARKGPESRPQRSITNFSEALSCMDKTFTDYGVRDVSVLVEDVVDQTKKVNAGTKDMLISAVSDMTKRSRAIKLIAFGQDSGNLISFLQQAERKNAYQVIPQFDIKGSITQWDENVIQNQKDLGLGLDADSYGVNFGVSRDAAASILGLDLTMLSTADLSIMNGVTSRNSVVLFKEGKGYDADARIQKFGINFNMNFSKSEGQSQALRNLVELAAIELFGKLTKTPYWSCLGSTTGDEGVQAQISEWFDSMYAHPEELVSYFQKQLRTRGYYQGPVDGEVNPQITRAVAAYRTALGLSEEPRLDLDFFKAYLSANHAEVLAKFPPPEQALAPESESEAVAPGTGDLSVSIASSNKSGKYAPGDLISLTITPSRDAYVYCYMQDETQQVMRFYPNRFSQDSLVRRSAPLRLPDNKHFEIVANDKRITETVACFAAEREVGSALPATALGTDFEYLPVGSIEAVRDLFLIASEGKLGEGYYRVESK